MSILARALEKYLQLRRNLGTELQGVDSGLRDFVAFATREGSSHITTDVALRWAQEPLQALPATWAARLRWVRGFALWLSASDARTEVPPAGLLSSHYQRRPPYIYSDAEIAAILRAAGQLASPKGLRGRTYSTIFGLLSVTGMRVSEALALDREDVDLKQGILKIRQTKFRKSRLVPLHESTCQVLASYARVRGRAVPWAATAAYFLYDRRSPDPHRVFPGCVRPSVGAVARSGDCAITSSGDRATTWGHCERRAVMLSAAKTSPWPRAHGFIREGEPLRGCSLRDSSLRSE